MNAPGGTEDQDALIYAYRLDGRGGGEPLDWHGLHVTEPDDRPLWVHLHRGAPESRDWLTATSGIDPLIVEALLAEETRPRCTALGNGVILNLRGVNLNPESDPDDMVSIRLWMDGNRIVSTRARRLMAVEDLHKALARGNGPKGIGSFIVTLAGRLVERMEPIIQGIDDQIDDLEEQVLSAHGADLHHRLGQARRQAVGLRRYIAPQREALAQMCVADVPWLDNRNRNHLREIADRVTRYVEDLDAARERGALVQDELSNRLATQMNRTMYILSIVAGVFLPLGLITGLLGINVGGIPGADTPWAFAAVCAVLIALGAGQVWVFRRLKWI